MVLVGVGRGVGWEDGCVPDDRGWLGRFRAEERRGAPGSPALGSARIGDYVMSVSRPLPFLACGFPPLHFRIQSVESSGTPRKLDCTRKR